MTESIPTPEQAEDTEGVFGQQVDERWLSLIDTALKAQTPLAHSYVERLREKRPGATRAELTDVVTSRFTTLATATGAGIGGIAALPGLGAVAAVGLTVGEGVSFAENCAFVTLAVADIHEVDMADPETRRLVLMAVLSGERGTEIIARALGKQGVRWNSLLGGGSGGGFLPNLVTRQVSRHLRRRIVARSGTLWLTRLLPFGIGALIGGFGARAVAGTVVEAVREIFSAGPVIDGDVSSGRPALGA